MALQPGAGADMLLVAYREARQVAASRGYMVFFLTGPLTIAEADGMGIRQIPPVPRGVPCGDKEP